MQSLWFHRVYVLGGDSCRRRAEVHPWRDNGRARELQEGTWSGPGMADARTAPRRWTLEEGSPEGRSVLHPWGIGEETTVAQDLDHFGKLWQEG